MRARASLLVFSLLLILATMATSLVDQAPRFLSAIVPLYLGQAQLCRRWPSLERWWLSCSGAMLAVNAVLFFRGYPTP
jgi:hypothetical protein